MKKIIAVLMMLSLILTVGCQSTVSPQGGTLPQDKEFSVSVPTRSTIKQGESMAVLVTLDRAPFFKRDVTLETSAEGLDVTPEKVVIKASEKAEAELQIEVPRDAALGEYRVYVKATPEVGKPTSTEFTVKVVAP